MSEVKTPSSLKWLITKRARLIGEIKKVVAARDTDLADLAQEIAKLANEMSDVNRRQGESEASANQILAILQADLNAIDATIRLHEIGINPDLISPIRTQVAGRLLPHGDVTRLILERLRFADGNAVTTTEVALYVAEKGHLYLQSGEFQVFRYSVRHRLKFLCRNGAVRRAHQAKTSLEGRWLLGNGEAPQEEPLHNSSPGL